MTIKDLLKKYFEIEIDLLLMTILKKPREFLYINPDYRLSKSQLNHLFKLIHRRQKHEPIAYLLGYKNFMGLRFKVNKHTLVPRPETEYLVDLLVKDIELSLKSTLTVLDVGTGSGCIAVSLGESLKNINKKVKLLASDVSPTALLVAKKNSELNKVKVKFYKSNLLKKIPDNLKIDIIAANLPYGWREWKNNTTTHTIGLKFEPEQALFTKERGLYEIRRLLEQIAKRSNQPELIFLEFDPRQKLDLAKLIKFTFPNSSVSFFKDLNKMWRFVRIKNI